VEETTRVRRAYLWILGTIVLVLGIFFLWIERDEELTTKSA